MKVSLSWAQYYSSVDLLSLPISDLVKLASERLGGVEGVTDLSKHYEGIVVAKVMSTQKHANADKLTVCKIDDGGAVKDVARDENGYVQVVCGAKNVREGILVAWIPPASIVPVSYGEKELFVLEARDLRGELSNGMLASPRELGVSEDHEGILEIDPQELSSSGLRGREGDSTRNGGSSSKIDSQLQTDSDNLEGTPFKQLYGLDDTIIEIENKMFTHRPDGFGQLGVARELAGIQHKAFISPDWYSLKFSDEQLAKYDALTISNDSNNPNNEPKITDNPLTVHNEVEELCPRYMAVVIDGIEVKPSPIWLQSYLKRVGIRPINNVVDITNYMMMLTAQPLHAFDFDKVAKDGQVDITVRHPKTDETMTLLDGKQIKPHKDAVLICNPDGPIALGGVMGGGNSEVDQNTKRVVLECATFNMYNIRKTSMIHGIFTDAVTRFNKGQPAAQLPPVLSKTIQMFNELAGGKVASSVVDCVSSATKESLLPDYIEITADFINKRLGSNFTDEEIVSLLNNVEFEAHVASGPISVTPPFWRTDIEIPEDIVEEVGRLYGFNQLPLALPRRSIKPVVVSSAHTLQRQVRETLRRAGANELHGYSFVHGDLLKKVGQKPDDSYALRNALSPDLQYYRQSITPSLLEAVHPNVKAGFDSFVVFEIGKAHAKSAGLNSEELPVEMNRIGVVYAQAKASEDQAAAYYYARRYLDYLAQSLAIDIEYTPLSEQLTSPMAAPFDFTRSAQISIAKSGAILGIIGEYSAEVTQALKLPQSTAGFEIDFDVLLQAKTDNQASVYQPLSRFPSVEQDLTLKVVSELHFSMLSSAINSFLEANAGQYNWEVKPLSIFQKPTDDYKNITFRLKIAHNDRTLTTQEVQQLVQSIADNAHELFNAEQI